MERIIHEERRRARGTHVASGTLACPSCDAPVSPPRAMSPEEGIGCPYCGHGAAVRDFLSLAAPARAARVAVRIAGW